MKYLSHTKAATISRLAADSRKEYVQRRSGSHVIDSGELKALILEPDSQEKIALKNYLRELTHAELLDLVALMCVGRGEHVEEASDPASIRGAFEGHVRSFSKDTSDQLLDYISGKSAAVHRYFAQGLERVQLMQH